MHVGSAFAANISHGIEQLEACTKHVTPHRADNIKKDVRSIGHLQLDSVISAVACL